MFTVMFALGQKATSAEAGGMSAKGHLQTFRPALHQVRLPPKADMIYEYTP